MLTAGGLGDDFGCRVRRVERGFGDGTVREWSRAWKYNEGWTGAGCNGVGRSAAVL